VHEGQERGASRLLLRKLYRAMHAHGNHPFVITGEKQRPRLLCSGYAPKPALGNVQSGVAFEQLFEGEIHANV
jgi:hypothetical protein